MADYQIQSITKEIAEKIITWSYQPPYGFYDLSPEDLSGLLTPKYRYHQVLDQDGNLIGYCCYGLDARVTGGDYSRGEPEVLDVGVGMNPKKTGQGRGAAFVGAILEYGAAAYQPTFFRATIADFNQRSLRTFQNLGFEIKGRFLRKLGDFHFFQLERLVKEF